MTDESESLVTVALPRADAEVSAAVGIPTDPWAGIVVAHGAGSGYDHPFLVGLTASLRAAGVATLRFNFPYRQAGRRLPGPAAHAVATWSAVGAWAAERFAGAPLFVSGRSYGGRMASLWLAEQTAAPVRGAIYLGYPLHPPGKPDAPRVAHLPEIAVPQLFLSGTRDPFVEPACQLEEAVASCQDARVVWVPDAGHSFDVAGRRRAPEDVGADLASQVIDGMREILGSQRPTA